MAVTVKQEKFMQDGYCIFDPEIPEHVLDEAVAATKGTMESGTAIGNQGYNGRAQDLHWWHDSVKRLALHPRVLATVAELYGVAPLAFQTLNFEVGTEQPPHSDTVHFNSIPAGWMCGVWIALEDIGPEQGPFSRSPAPPALLLRSGCWRRPPGGSKTAAVRRSGSAGG